MNEKGQRLFDFNKLTSAQLQKIVDVGREKAGSLAYYRANSLIFHRALNHDLTDFGPILIPENECLVVVGILGLDMAKMFPSDPEPPQTDVSPPPVDPQ